MSISAVIKQGAQNYTHYQKKERPTTTPAKHEVSAREDLFVSSIPSPSVMDRGTAAETTLHISRGDFDTMVHASTYGEPQWEELGCDEEKRWVVINGQRFEVEHSPEEKALWKRRKMTLLDYMKELDDEREEREKRSEKVVENRKNLPGLEMNEVVSGLLKKLFGDNYKSIFSV